MQKDKIEQFFVLAGELSISVIDKQIEYHSQQLDQLRLLRQIVAIQEEASFVGSSVEIAKKKQRDNIAVVPTETETTKFVVSLTEKSTPSKTTSGYVSTLQKFPVEGTHAWKIYRVLSEFGELSHAQILKEAKLPHGSLGTVFRIWIKNGVFEKVDRGRYRLTEKHKRQETNNTLVTALPVEEKQVVEFPKFSDVEVIADHKEVVSEQEPLNGNAFRVRAYLQRSQPAKPMVIAADLNIPLSEVVLILQQHSCFQMNGKGWMLKKAEQKEETTFSRCLS